VAATTVSYDAVFVDYFLKRPVQGFGIERLTLYARATQGFIELGGHAKILRFVYPEDRGILTQEGMGTRLGG